RVPLAEEVVLLAEPLEELEGQRAIGDALPYDVLRGRDLRLHGCEARHELVHRERRTVFASPALPDVPEHPFAHVWGPPAPERGAVYGAVPGRPRVRPAPAGINLHDQPRGGAR